MHTLHYFLLVKFSSNKVYFSLTGGSDSKESTCQCGRPEFNPWVRKIPWSRKWQPTPVFLPGEFHGQRSLVGTVHGLAESDTTEQLTHTQSLLYFFCSFLPILFLHHLALVVWFHDPFFGYITIQNCSVRGRGYYFTCQNVAYYYIDVIIDFQYCPGIWKSLVRGQILLLVHLTNNESINHW